MSAEEITVQSIKEQMQALGIQPGDKVIMHSNLRSLGKARVLAKLPNCGADYILDGCLEAVGPEGLVCLPTFTSTFMGPMGGPTGEIFDPETTPSRVGSITNVFRTRPEAIRSHHPTHSWAAIGKDAEEFVAGHDTTSTFGRDSICGRMYDWDTKIMWFGTTGQTNTSTHFAEDWLDLPNMTSEDVLVKDGDGFKKVTVFRSPSGPRDFYKLDSKTEKMIIAAGIKTEGKVHAADVTVLRHRDLMNNLLRAMIDDPCLLLADNKDDHYHRHFYRLNRESMECLKAEKGGKEGILKDLDCLKD